MGVSGVKIHIQREVDRLDPLLREIALKIHQNPELVFEEHQADLWLTAPLGMRALM